MKGAHVVDRCPFWPLSGAFPGCWSLGGADVNRSSSRRLRCVLLVRFAFTDELFASRRSAYATLRVIRKG